MAIDLQRLAGNEELLDPEIKALLQKYAGGRMPPLVDVERPKSGLIDGELLSIYREGMLSMHSLSLGVLLAAKSYVSLEEKWGKADFVLDEWAMPHWVAFCSVLRATEVGNRICEKCNGHRAAMAEKERDVIAYLCNSGMIDFAAPISVEGEVVGVLITGQFKPKEGPIWNPELIRPDGCFRPLLPEEAGIDGWVESQRRIRNAEWKAGLPEGTLLRTLSASPAIEVAPQAVEEIQRLLRRAATQLSDLATSIYESEKSKVVDWIQNQVTRSLAPLRTTPLETSKIWERLSFSLEYMISYFGLDYALILSSGDETEKGLKVLCQSGLPTARFPNGKSQSATAVPISTLRSTLFGLKDPRSITLREYKDLPGFNRLHRLHRGGERVLVIPIPTSLESAACIMILGNFEKDVELDAFAPNDHEALERTSEEVKLVAEIALLVEQLKATARRQTLFLEDVAHDIRTPIEAILVQTNVLTLGLATPQETKRLARGLAAQVRRLHLLNQRVWMLVYIERGVFEPGEEERVSVYQTIMEHRKQLLDLAESRNIQILVARELEEWPTIQVNKMLFSQAVLNLIDNAVKYSRDQTEIRIDGRRSPGGVSLSFVNRGIPIREEEKDRIFARYYRSKEAVKHIPVGTGIGLSIVKAFVDHCRGNIEVNSVPIRGTQDYVTEFRVFIPQWR